MFVGADDTIQNLDTYRGYLAQLADPRTISDQQAKEVIAKAKPLYHLSGGLHSGEVGPSEMLMELTYRLATEDSALIRQIRDNVIVSITPVADPDGRDRNVDWYYKYGINETDGHPTGAGVPYWGKYIFHDDNRDINYSQVEMRALLDWYLQWHPPIMHDLHQAQTLLYTFSGQAPQNPNLDPILYGELPMMANFEMAQLTKYGMPGVWTHGYVDMWSPGYLAFMSSNHNGMIRMYEIQGTSGANTTKMRLGNPNAAAAGRGRGGAAAPDAAAITAGRSNQSEREWFRPWPATGEFDWSLRNNTNYGETGVLTALQYTAAFPNVILENFYQKSRNSVDTGRKEAVAGYVIPAGPARRDAGRATRQHAAHAGHRSRHRQRRSEAERRHLPRRLLHRQTRSTVRPARENPARETGLPGSGDADLRRCVVDDGNDEPDRGEGDRGQGGARCRGHAGDRGQAGRLGDGQRFGVRRRAPRLEQHDHAALPAQESEGSGGGKGIQAGCNHLPRRILHRVGRRGSDQVSDRVARARRGGAAGGAGGPDARSGSAAAGRVHARGAARRTSAGFATPSTNSRCRSI